MGSPCPAGDFSDELPADRNIVYVKPGGAGDGTSPATPHGSITDFSISGLPTGTVIALSRGTHLGPVRLTRGVSLWGACAAETIFTTGEPSETEGVVTFIGAGELHDLTVASSPRPGLWLDGAGVEGLLEGLVVEDTELAGVVAVLGARLTARDSVVRGTRGRSRGGFLGRGLHAEAGALVEVTRALFEANRDVGVYAADADTTLTLADAVVRDTLAQESDGLLGRGLHVQRGAAAQVSRALFERNHEVGVSAHSTDTSLTLTDVVVRDTRAREGDGTLGFGFAVQLGATGHASRCLFERNRDFHVTASDPGAVLTLADVVVRDTLPRRSDGAFGRGLAVQAGARTDVTRALLEANREVAVFVDGAATALTLVDAVVRDTVGRQSDGSGGRALGVQVGATAEVTRALFEASRDVGVVVSGSDSALTLADAVVRNTDGQESDGIGYLSDGEVREQPVGVCLQVDGYDTDRLTNRVRFIDNDVNLQATSLPVPGPVDALPESP